MAIHIRYGMGGTREGEFSTLENAGPPAGPEALVQAVLHQAFCSLSEPPRVEVERVETAGGKVRHSLIVCDTVDFVTARSLFTELRDRGAMNTIWYRAGGVKSILEGHEREKQDIKTAWRNMPRAAFISRMRLIRGRTTKLDDGATATLFYSTRRAAVRNAAKQRSRGVEKICERKDAA